jgi:hypothetical protein
LQEKNKRNTPLDRRMAWFQSKLAVKDNPRLNWDMNRSCGVTRSGWNPLVGLRVSIFDESLSKDKVSIFIEPAAPGTGKLCFMTFTPMIVLLPILLPILVSKSTAKAYIFSKNVDTGKIDLLYRVKPFRDEKIRVVFEDVTNFGIKFQGMKHLRTNSRVASFSLLKMDK